MFSNVEHATPALHATPVFTNNSPFSTLHTALFKLSGRSLLAPPFSFVRVQAGGFECRFVGVGGPSSANHRGDCVRVCGKAACVHRGIR